MKIGLPRQTVFDTIDPQRRPGMHGWVYIIEVPLIGWELPVGVHRPFATKENELTLGESGIDKRENNTVKGKVPGSIPRILPGVGHREHIEIIEVPPIVITSPFALGRWGRKAWVSIQPGGYVIVVELLAPQHAGKGLELDVFLIFGSAIRHIGGIKIVGLLFACPKNPIKRGSKRLGYRGPAGKPQPHLTRFTGSYSEAVTGSRLRTRFFRIDRLRPALHNIIVDTILYIG